MIDVVAGDRIKALIREIQLHGVALPELDIADALGGGIFLAQCFAEGGIFLPPSVDAHKAGPGVSPGTGDGQGTAAAADVQSDPALGEIDHGGDPLDDLPGHLPVPVIREGTVHPAHPQCRSARGSTGKQKGGGQTAFCLPVQKWCAAADGSQAETADCPCQRSENHALWHPVFVIGFCHGFLSFQ